MSNEATKNVVRGYKVFNPDWTCDPRGNTKQYTCPGKFEEDVELEVCGRGMHFCERLIDCFSYYIFNPNNKVAEVIAYGDVVTDWDKSCTNKLEIVRELSWEEVLRLVNTGENCTGFGNTGSDNSGDYNTGSGNSGHRNTGNNNSGNHNTGDSNSGNHNTGYYNSGDCNTGDWNFGSYNTGDGNKSSNNTGCFNTEESKITMFNKPSNWTLEDWIYSDAKQMLSLMPFDLSQRQKWWNNLSEEDKTVIKEIPNFDADIFYECMGIRVDEEE